MRNCWIWCFLALAAFPNLAFSQAETTASLGGRVIHASTGESIRKAHVTLEPANSRVGSKQLVATTDDAGHFRFADVKEGVYRLTSAHTGFLGGGYGQTKYEDSQTLLKVQAGDRIRDVTLRLFPAGIISGRVLDPDGDPAPGYEVVLWARHNIPYSPGGQEISGLNESEVPVDKDGKVTNVRELRTFYPASISLAEAQTIHIASAQEQSGIDIHVQRGPLLSVKGRILGAIGSDSKLPH